MPKSKPETKPEPDAEIDSDTEDSETQDDADDMPVVEIPFSGVTFKIPQDRGDWSTEAVAWLAERKFNLFTKYLLEGTQPGQWKALCAACPRQRDFTAFFVLIGSTIREKCIGE